MQFLSRIIEYLGNDSIYLSISLLLTYEKYNHLTSVNKWINRIKKQWSLEAWASTTISPFTKGLIAGDILQWLCGRVFYVK